MDNAGSAPENRERRAGHGPRTSQTAMAEKRPRSAEVDWEEELAKAIEEDDLIASSAAWKMCYPGSSGDEAVQMLTRWD